MIKGRRKYVKCNVIINDVSVLVIIFPWKQTKGFAQ